MMEAPMPANESREHFLLKQVGLIWLKMRGCQFVATEVDGMSGNTDADLKRDERGRQYRQLYEMYPNERFRRMSRRSVADVVGVQRAYRGYAWRDGKRVIRYRYTVRLIEVKVSRADFRSGYCTGAHFTYVMTPPGLVSPDELQPGIGLLEVDLEALAERHFARYIADVVNVVRKPKRQTDVEINPQHVIEDIAAKHTNHAVFKNPWLIKGAV